MFDDSPSRILPKHRDTLFSFVKVVIVNICLLLSILPCCWSSGPPKSLFRFKYLLREEFLEEEAKLPVSLEIFYNYFLFIHL